MIELGKSILEFCKELNGELDLAFFNKIILALVIINNLPKAIKTFVKIIKIIIIACIIGKSFSKVLFQKEKLGFSIHIILITVFVCRKVKSKFINLSNILKNKLFDLNEKYKLY